MKNFISIFFAILLFYTANCQDISGKWNGYLYQDAGGLKRKYDFSMNLNQTENQISGYSKIALMDNKKIFGVISLKGKIKNSKFDFEEISIIEQGTGNINVSWCIKKGTLIYSQKGKTATIQGDWSSTFPNNCSPGSIVLTKNNNKKHKDNSNKEGKKGN